jgi:hypothetical protein
MKYITALITGSILSSIAINAQSIDVTPNGVNIGATTSTTAGALLKQSGQEMSFFTQDGINPPDLRLIIKGTGNVGIGTNTPSEKLEIIGNTKTSGSATVGSLVVGTSTLFNAGSFESPEFPIPGNGSGLTVAHGLGGLPRFSTVVIRCKNAELGWAVGDEIVLNSIDIISNNQGVTIATNAANFKLTQYGSIYIHYFMVNANYVVAITPANWRLVFRAWR